MIKKFESMKRWAAVLMTAMLTASLLPMECLNDLAGIDDSLLPSEVQAAETLSNPRIVEDSTMDAGQTVTWDCVYFGSYPQTEVVEAGSEEEAALVKMNRGMSNNGVNYRVDYESVSSSAFAQIETAAFDGNGDATVNGVRYRRLKGEESTASGTGSYDFVDDTSYHYFKYEPVKWRVLSVDDGQALLLSDEALDCQLYHVSRGDITWEGSTIRSWLNGYGSGSNLGTIDYSSKNFIDCAFSAEEQTAIPTTTVINNVDNYYYEGFNGENNTQDKVFLLSETEIWIDKTATYGFVNVSDIKDEARRSVASAFAYAKGTRLNLADTCTPHAYISCNWWLRSPGAGLGNVIAVFFPGQISGGGISPSACEDIGVRPALYLDLSKTSLYSLAGTVSSDEVYNRDSSGTDTGGETNTGNTAGSGSETTNTGSNPTAAKENFSRPASGSSANTVPPTGTTLSESTVSYTVTTAGSAVTYSKNLNTKAATVTVPSSVKIGGITYKVTSIADNAFKNNKKLKKVTIGSNVTSIGNSAFRNCTALKKVVIPAKVKQIGKKAFYNCKKLQSLTIKAKKLTAKTVGAKAFAKAGSSNYSKLKVKVPKKKYTAYVKMLKKKGLSARARVSK